MNPLLRHLDFPVFSQWRFTTGEIGEQSGGFLTALSFFFLYLAVGVLASLRVYLRRGGRRELPSSLTLRVNISQSACQSEKLLAARLIGIKTNTSYPIKTISDLYHVCELGH